MYACATGKLDSGLDYIELRAGEATARILPAMGFNLYSWTAHGRQIMMTPVDILERGCKYGTPLLFPTPNRVVDGVYQWGGKTYRQTKRGETKLIHGLVNDEAFAFTCGADGGSAHATGTLDVVPGTAVYEAFPFPCSLHVRYDLTQESLLLTYHVANTGDEDLPFGFAIHPFYNKDPDPARIVITHPLTRAYEAVEAFPTGKMIDVSGQAADFTAGRTVANAFIDQVYDGMDSQGAVSVDYLDWGWRQTFRASNDLGRLVIYTPPHRPCFCVENQSCSTNAHNLHANGLADIAHLIVLPPKRTHTGTIEQTLSKL